MVEDAGKTNSRQLNREMGEKNLFRALPLLRRGRNLVRLEFPPFKVWYGVDDDPRNAASKVNNLEKVNQYEKAFSHLSQDVLLTSCIMKLMRPVAMTGLLIQIYHAAQSCSSQLSVDRSTCA